MALSEDGTPRSQYRDELRRNSIYLTLKPFLRDEEAVPDVATLTLDPPAAGGGGEATKPFPFLSLPLEIRREIYTHALKPPTHKHPTRPGHTTTICLTSRHYVTATTNTGVRSTLYTTAGAADPTTYAPDAQIPIPLPSTRAIPCPALLYLSRALHAEAAEFLYAANRFHFLEARCVGFWLDAVGPRNAAFVRRGPVEILWLDWTIQHRRPVPRMPQWSRTIRLLASAMPNLSLDVPVEVVIDVGWNEFVRCFWGLAVNYAGLKPGLRVSVMSLGDVGKKADPACVDAMYVVEGEARDKYPAFWGERMVRDYTHLHTVFCNGRCKTTRFQIAPQSYLYRPHNPTNGLLNGPAPAPPPPTPGCRPFTFLALPLTVRKRIYALLLAPSTERYVHPLAPTPPTAPARAPTPPQTRDHKPALLVLYEYGYFHRTGHAPHRVHAPTYPTLLRTCRQINQEATPVLYSQNTIGLCGGNPLLWLDGIGERNVGLLRRVEVRYGSLEALRRDVPVLRGALGRLVGVEGLSGVEVRVGLVGVPYLFGLRGVARRLREKLGEDGFGVYGVMDGGAVDVGGFMDAEEAVGWDFNRWELRSWREIEGEVLAAVKDGEGCWREEHLCERWDLWVEEWGEGKGLDGG